jgi:DnaJ-class molecular chaperone
MPDFYAVLGVNRSSGIDEIRSAYRKLAVTLHPDRNPGDKAKEARFQEVSEAYSVLSDDGKRARYDLACLQPARVPVYAPPFRSGGRGFVFRGFNQWGSPTNATTNTQVDLGRPIDIHVNPNMAGQTVQVQFRAGPVPGVFVFVRKA